MTRFDTSVQYHSWRERRLVGLALTALLVIAAVAVVVEYVHAVATSPSPLSTFPLAAALLLGCLALVPFAVGLGRREHPTQVEVTDEALTLTFQGGRTARYPWADGPLDLALDGRSAQHHRPAEGMECKVWIPVQGRDPQVPAFRPLELIVSGAAFEGMSAGMARAGFRPVRQPWGRHRPGDMIQFVRPGEEARAPPVEPPRRSLFGPGG